MQFLNNPDLVDIILSAEVLFSVIFTLSLFIAVHAILSFVRQSNSLYTRLAQVEADLNVLHASIPGKLERTREMRTALAPLRKDFEQIQAYHARLQHLERKAVEEEMAKEREQEDLRDRKIQRRQLGLDRLL